MVAVALVKLVTMVAGLGEGDTMDDGGINIFHEHDRNDLLKLLRERGRVAGVSVVVTGTTIAMMVQRAVAMLWMVAPVVMWLVTPVVMWLWQYGW